MTSVICSKRDCKHYNHGYCQLDEILIMGGFYKDIPYCSDYEQDIPYCSDYKQEVRDD